MHPYVPLLLEDIKAAERSDELRQITRPQTLEEELAEIDRWTDGEYDTDVAFSEKCGLQSEQFPDAEQLSEEDLKVVITSFRNMLSTWNVEVDLPEGMPNGIKYQHLINVLNRSFTPFGSGCYHIDFCTGDSSECELGEYCRCKGYLD